MLERYIGTNPSSDAEEPKDNESSSTSTCPIHQ